MCACLLVQVVPGSCSIKSKCVKATKVDVSCLHLLLEEEIHHVTGRLHQPAAFQLKCTEQKNVNLCLVRFKMSIIMS